MLDLINKSVTLDQVAEVFRQTKKVEITIRGFFMLGFPTETRSESITAIAFAKKLILCGPNLPSPSHTPAPKCLMTWIEPDRSGPMTGQNTTLGLTGKEIKRSLISRKVELWKN